jgi:UbiD family decarboxylase
MKEHLKDLRSFLRVLDAIGEVQPIDAEVDWNLEMGAVTRRSMDLRAPAPLFNRVKGAKDGFRALGAPGGLSANPRYKYARVSLALGLGADAHPLDIVRALAEARGRSPIPPVVRPKSGAPCKENVLLGDEVDLTSFPVPHIHQHDGGRYLQTYGLNIVKTPDGAWTNWSINRMMLLDGKRLACLIPPNQHLGIIHAKWKAAGTPTPIAIALGVEPGLPYVGGMPIPEGADESAFLGAHFGEPLDLVPAETVDLLVPATAEIVVEGHISHGETEMEGPMDEYPGYIGDRGSPKPVLLVSAVTHRDSPILPFSCAGVPVDENHTGWGLPHAAEILYMLRDADGLPVDICWMVPESACHLLVIGMDPAWHEKTGLGSREICQRIGDRIFTSKPGFGVAKIVLVENDVDVTDVEQMLWAFTTRAHPEHGEVLFRNEAQNALPVFLDPDEKHTFRAVKVIHNALLADRFAPADRPVRSDFEHAWPRAVQDLVRRQWGNYGYKEATR